MWIFTRYGYYSVVEHNQNPDFVLIRARKDVDLKRLAAVVTGLGFDEPTISHTPANDYLWRVTLPKWQWAKTVEAMAQAIDYTNFKNAVHDGTDRDMVYMAVWLRLQEWQDQHRRPRNKIKPISNRQKRLW